MNRVRAAFILTYCVITFYVGYRIHVFIAEENAKIESITHEDNQVPK